MVATARLPSVMLDGPTVGFGIPVEAAGEPCVGDAPPVRKAVQDTSSGVVGWVAFGATATMGVVCANTLGAASSVGPNTRPAATCDFNKLRMKVSSAVSALEYLEVLQSA